MSVCGSPAHPPPPEFLGLPVRFYHDFAHGRGLHAKVDWAVFKFKYKWLKAALTKVVAAEAGVEQVVSVDVVKGKYEKLCDDPTREKVREFVATNILGGREYIKARILDEGMYEGSVDELLDSYGERYFADGSIITDYQLFPTVNGGLPYRRIPIHQATGFKQPVNEKGGAFKGYRGGDKHFPTMQVSPHTCVARRASELITSSEQALNRLCRAPPRFVCASAHSLVSSASSVPLRLCSHSYARPPGLHRGRLRVHGSRLLPPDRRSPARLAARVPGPLALAHEAGQVGRHHGGRHPFRVHQERGDRGLRGEVVCGQHENARQLRRERGGRGGDAGQYC